MFAKVAKLVTLPVNYDELSYVERIEVRSAYASKQKGKCYYCKEPLDGIPSKEVTSKNLTYSLFPNGFFDYPVHLHHDHNTSMTIGAVHCRCNAVLWEHEGE